MLLSVLMLLMMVLPAFAATSVTTPADNADLAIGTTYEFTGSTALGGAYNCTWYYLHKGETTWTTLSTSTLINATDANYTVPVSYGTNSFNLTCTNGTTTESDATTESVGLRYYDNSEMTEVVVDFIMEFWIQILAFASVIALGALYLWGRSQLK